MMQRGGLSLFQKSPGLSGEEPKGENQTLTPEGVLLPEGAMSPRDN